MTRISAALAASATAFALLLAGCNDDTASSSTPASSAGSSVSKPSGDAAQVIDAAKAGTFVISFKNAFPTLAKGRTDAQISEILVRTCTDLKSGKAQDAVVAGIAAQAGNGSTKATTEDAQAIYQIAHLICG